MRCKSITQTGCAIHLNHVPVLRMMLSQSKLVLATVCACQPLNFDRASLLLTWGIPSITPTPLSPSDEV